MPFGINDKEVKQPLGGQDMVIAEPQGTVKSKEIIDISEPPKFDANAKVPVFGVEDKVYNEQQLQATPEGWILPNQWGGLSREEKLHYLVSQYVARPVTDFARGYIGDVIKPLFEAGKKSGAIDALPEEDLDKYLQSATGADNTKLGNFLAFGSKLSGYLRGSAGALTTKIFGNAPKAAQTLKAMNEMGLIGAMEVGTENLTEAISPETEVGYSAGGALAHVGEYTALGAAGAVASRWVGNAFSKLFGGKSKDVVYKMIGLDEKLLGINEQRTYATLLEKATRSNEVADWEALSDFVQGTNRPTYESLLEKIGAGEDVQKSIDIITEEMFRGGKRSVAASSSLAKEIWSNPEIDKTALITMSQQIKVGKVIEDKLIKVGIDINKPKYWSRPELQEDLALVKAGRDAQSKLAPIVEERIFPFKVDYRNLPVDAVPGTVINTLAKEVAPQIANPAANSVEKNLVMQQQAQAGEPVIWDTLVQKVNGLIGQQKRLAPLTADLQSKALGKKAAQAEEVYRSGLDPELLGMSRRFLGGELPKAEFTPFGEKLSQNEILSVTKRIRQDPDLNYFDAANTEEAFYKLQGGLHLQDNEIRKLVSLFGKGTEKVLKDRLTFWDKAGRFASNALNFQRAVLTSWDMSAIGNQGIMWLPTAPKEWARAAKSGFDIWFAGWKSADSLAAYEKLMGTIRTRTNTHLLKGYGGKYDIGLVSTSGKSWKLSSQEEAFMSEWAERIVPGTKKSELSYTGTLNNLRSQLWEKFTAEWEGTGKSGADYETLAAFIRHSTGRGDLPGFLGKHNAEMSTIFFAPRFLAGRIESFTDLISATSATRQIIAKTLVGYVGTGASMLGLLYAAGKNQGVVVETNILSSKFGEVRFGNTTFNIWGSYQNLARSTAQFIGGIRFDSDTKKYQGIERTDVLIKFLRSKLSPPAALSWDMASGSTVLGDEILPMQDLYSKEGKKDLIQAVVGRVAPMFYQNIQQAARYDGIGMTIAVAPLSWGGIGINSYPIPESKQAQIIKDELANSYFGRGWDDIGPDAQKALREFDNRIPLSEMRAEASQEHASSGRFLKEQFDSSQFIKKQMPTSVKVELDRLYMDVPGVGRNIATNYHLSDAKYKEYKQMYAKVSSAAITNLMSKPGWNRQDDNSKRDLLSLIFSNVGLAVRGQIVQTANEKDLIYGVTSDGAR